MGAQCQFGSLRFLPELQSQSKMNTARRNDICDLHQLPVLSSLRAQNSQKMFKTSHICRYVMLSSGGVESNFLCMSVFVLSPPCVMQMYWWALCWVLPSPGCVTGSTTPPFRTPTATELCVTERLFPRHRSANWPTPTTSCLCRSTVTGSYSSLYWCHLFWVTW